MLVGIQADDLTGACDTGAPFAARGLETLVVVHDGDDPPPMPSATPTVLVIDTESRQRPIEDARELARWAGTTLKAGSPGMLYKKVDSTLRGRVAAEIDGMLDGTGLEMALLSPAFPAQRRIVVDGRLLVDGQPADQTPIALDPTFPRIGASVLGILAADGMRPIAVLPLGTVRRAARRWRARALARSAVASSPPTPRRPRISRSRRRPAGTGRPLAGSAGSRRPPRVARPA
jgi:uncharacterized protein YgbK (DUF1537 family)